MMHNLNDIITHDTIAAYQQQLDNQRSTISALEAELDSRTRLSYPAYTITRTGIQFTGQLSFDEWMSLGELIAQERTRWQWALGTWILEGEHRYGETYAAAIDLTQYSQRTLEEYVYVCRSIPFEMRSERLSFSHHKIVAGLWLDEWQSLSEDDQHTVKRKAQEVFLTAAKQGDWTVDNLRGEVKRWRADSIVADLRPEKQREFVNRVMSDEWTLTELREAVREWQEAETIVKHLPEDKQRELLTSFDAGAWSLDDFRWVVGLWEQDGIDYEPPEVPLVEPSQIAPPSTRVSLGQFRAVGGKLTIELDDGDYAVYVERLGDE